MATEWAIFCKLGGHINSKREIIGVYPEFPDIISEPNKILDICFPVGTKPGDFILNKYNKFQVLSYIFKIPKTDERDDLLSYSILIEKKEKAFLYKFVMVELFHILEENNMLSEELLMENQQKIYQGLNTETDIDINGIKIQFSKIFEDFRNKLIKKKPNLKGSFF
ncbi:MAG: hypothetical protein ACTSVX_08055 [Promethearchaeota archaeon]